MSPSVEVSGVTVVYNNGHTALRDASFVLRPGSIAGLVGANGSGKSTLFKTIMGFLKPASGFVKINGGPVRDAQKASLISYVPQTEEVDWTFPVSVRDVVMTGRYGTMGFLRIPKAEDKAIVEESLARVRMTDFGERQIGELSGGQKKRVFLARALAQRGTIMLLDEPFTGVDVKTEAAIIDLLEELRDEGHTILVSTHDLGSVPEFCDQVVLVKGTVLGHGPTEELFTEQNLTEVFGGVLRQFQFESSTIQEHDGRSVKLFSDDERPLVFGKDGHLEYKSRKGREHIVREREREETEGERFKQ